VVEHGAPQIGGDALADPRHEVEASERRACHHGDDDEHQRQRSIELSRVAGAKPSIDDALETLSDRKHRGGRDDERDRSDDHLLAVRAGGTRRRGRAS
jgi:hypothetical protein